MMRRPWWLMVILCGVVLTIGASSEGDDLDRNRRLLDRWRADPEHYARLLRDLRGFYAMPRERQEQIRTFDRALHEGDVTRQTRLWAVLDRYVAWLAKLDESERRRILDAPDDSTRLAYVQEIRDREWVDRLPASLRGEVQALPAQERAARIVQLRAEEKKQRLLWLTGSSSKDGSALRPRKRADLPAAVQSHLTLLEPRLTAEEKERLRQAEGKWPELLQTVRELAELHPILPPLPSGPITSWTELPAEVRSQLQGIEKRKVKHLQRNSANRWPEFALDVTRLLRQEKLSAPALGASRLAEFPPEVQAFVKTQLLPRLGPFQRETLSRTEGRWPDYPVMLLRLARDRRLVIPGMSLPGPSEMWESVRLPDVPDHLLMQFALHESSAEDRATWELDTSDPMGSREKVKKAWYRKRLAEQERKRKTGWQLNAGR